jgi:hypothetical protein
MKEMLSPLRLNELLGAAWLKAATQVLPEMAETVGIAKSSVSREFVEARAAELKTPSGHLHFRCCAARMSPTAIRSFISP